MVLLIFKQVATPFFLLFFKLSGYYTKQFQPKKYLLCAYSACFERDGYLLRNIISFHFVVSIDLSV